MRPLTSFRVAVAKPGSDPHRGGYMPWNLHVHYVVARTKKSASRQAKRMSGYTPEQAESPSAVQSCEPLEVLE